MKIIITGAHGNMGSYFCEAFKEEHTIFPLDKKKLDITNKTLCTEIIANIKPDLVIHTAALSNIDLCERDETAAYTINTIGCLNVAYACSLVDIPIIYLSCNNVYDGNKTSPYYETDICSPISVYGKTKLAGEKLIRTICNKYFIIRTSWVYGTKNCFVKNILDNKAVPIFMCSNEISSPTYIKDLCMTMSKMFVSDMYGIYNCTNSGAVKKSLWVKTILDYININKEVIEIPENFISNRAPRPKCTILNNSLIKNCFDIEMPSWDNSLKNFLTES